MFDQNKYLIFTPDFIYPGHSSCAKSSEDRQTQTSHSEDAQGTSSKSSSEDLAQCQLKLTEVQEKFVRNAADFENYKRRMQREQAQWLDVGATRVLTQLLSIADDFDRALAQQKSKPVTPEVASWLAGFELIHKSLQKMLESCDVREIPHNLPFDPERHEAIVSVESSGHASGDIVEILQKGYTYKDKILRPAQVSVAK